jgi:hypothetical protein
MLARFARRLFMARPMPDLEPPRAGLTPMGELAN